MSKEIRVKDKCVSLDGTTTLAVIALGVYDSETNEEYPAKFVQPQNLTTAYGGITEYGMLVFNSLNSDLDDTVTIAAVSGSETVSESATLEGLLDVDPGDPITAESESEGGEGGEP